MSDGFRGGFFIYFMITYVIDYFICTKYFIKKTNVAIGSSQKAALSRVTARSPVEL